MEMTWKEIREHLEFFGFEVEDVFDDQTSIRSLSAIHPTRSNLYVAELHGGFFFGCIYACKPEAKDKLAEKMELANILNSRASVARAYADNEGTFTIEGWFPALYSKAAFATFIENFERDVHAGFEANPKLTERIIK